MTGGNFGTLLGNIEMHYRIYMGKYYLEADRYEPENGKPPESCVGNG